MLVVPAKSRLNNYSRQIVFLKWRVANLLVGFPGIEICFGTRVRSLPDALRIATPKKWLPGAGGGFLMRATALTVGEQICEKGDCGN